MKFSWICECSVNLGTFSKTCCEMSYFPLWIRLIPNSGGLFHFASASFATEFSQELPYSSAEWSLGRPPSRLNSGHESTIWPHLNKFAQYWPWPVRWGRSKPGYRIVGSGTKPWLTTEADSQASLHCADMSIGAVFVQIGWNTSRLVGGCKTSAYTGQFSCVSSVYLRQPCGLHSADGVYNADLLITGRSNVEVVDTFTYLGSQLHSSGGSEHKVNRHISISRNWMQMLDTGQAHLAVQDLIEYQPLALQRVSTSGIPVWSRDVVHNQSYRRELMPLTNGVFGTSWTLAGQSMWRIMKSVGILDSHCYQTLCEPDALSCLNTWPCTGGQTSPKIIPVLYKPAYSPLQGTGVASKLSKTYLAEDSLGRFASIQFWSRVMASEGTKQISLADTHWNSNVTAKLRLIDYSQMTT